jgi:hypothetical protein
MSNSIFENMTSTLLNFINKTRQKKAAEVTDLSNAEKQLLLQILSEDAAYTNSDMLYYKDRAVCFAKKSDPDTEDGRAYFSSHSWCRKEYKRNAKRSRQLAEIIRKLKRQVRTSP